MNALGRSRLRIRCGLWSALAERSGDGALAEARCCGRNEMPRFRASTICTAPSQSGVALRLPPQSKSLRDPGGRGYIAFLFASA